MSEVTARTTKLTLTLSTETRMKKDQIEIDLRSVYDTKSGEGRLSDKQKLYIVEHVMTDTACDMIEMLKLKRTAAADLVIAEIEAEAAETQ